MNAIELFGAAIRVVGLFALARGCSDLVYVILTMTGNTDVSVTKPFPTADFVYGAVYFLIGLYFLRGAPFLIRFAFPSSDYDEVSLSADTRPTIDDDKTPE